MKHISIIVTIFGLSLVSCEKVKELANQATSALSNKLKDKIGSSEEQRVDASLQKLVDQTEDGVVFRKDLPFPQSISIKTTETKEISGRFFHASELGKKVETVKGTETVVTELERVGDSVRFTLRESNFTIPSVEGDGDKKNQPKIIKNPLRQAAPSTEPILFRKQGDTWKVDNATGFRAMVLSQQLAPVFDQLLIDNALTPRPLWFSKKRLKVGDELDVGSHAISMLVAGKAKGSLHLKFEAIEPVHGHPCGVFSVTGDFSRREFPDFEGRLTDEEVTVEDGKLWLSLLYPVVLKEQLNTIQTFKPGGEGGLVGRGQGVIKVRVDREWKVKPPEAGDETQPTG